MNGLDTKMVAPAKNDEAREEFSDILAAKVVEIVGYDQFGEVIDFYDEDGCIVLEVSVNEGNLIFNFGENSDYIFTPEEATINEDNVVEFLSEVIPVDVED